VRFARVGAPGAERPVVEGPDGRLHGLGSLTEDLTPRFLEEGLAAVERLLPSLPVLEDVPQRWGAPVVRPGKVVGIGLNYAAHADESGQPRPAEPVVFLKASTSVCGPGDDIRMLPGSVTTDYEVELGVVLGATLCAEDDPARALAAVAGYVLADDVSDRSLQLERGGTWTKGKSADTFCPLGPWLVTPDELGDPQALTLRLSVNGEPRQHAATSDMIFTVAEVLCYTSSIMTLEPGDVLVTGTPAGVALGHPDPKPYLRHDDVIEAGGGVLGTHRNRVVAHAATRHTVGTLDDRRLADGR
jgi:2-keto-4-pentenoate hydratase/2-oxohepta-3-ene-1,7-dioic acid hydratase in catechol pathway